MAPVRRLASWSMERGPLPATYNNMPSILDSLFAKPDAAPTMDTIDAAKEFAKASDFNQERFKDFQKYAPEQSAFMKDLFGQLYDSRAKQAEQTAFDIGNQLATGGQTDLMGDFFKYNRRLGLESAASTGAPTTSQFASGYAGSMGARSLLQNQLQGLGILGQQAQIQQGRAFQFMQPSLGQLQTSMVTPQQFYQAATYNNQIENINKQIDFQNSQRQSWFDTLLSDTLKSAVGMPFNLIQNANNVAASAPQIFAGMATSYIGGGGGGIMSKIFGGNGVAPSGGGGGGGSGSGIPPARTAGQVSPTMSAYQQPPSWFGGMAA